MIVIDDLTLTGDIEFFAYQKYYDAKIAYRFVELGHLEKRLRTLNYELKKKIPFKRAISANFEYKFDRDYTNFAIGETISLHFERSNPSLARGKT
jgi:hypothetical protein